MKKLIITTLTFTLLLCGCGETPHSGIYYSEHRDEAEKVAHECAKDAPKEGTVRAQNCSNAMTSLMFSHKR